MLDNIFTYCKILNNQYRRIFLYDYTIDMLIGVYEHEKPNPQPVIFNIDIFVPLAASNSKCDDINQVLDYNLIIDNINKFTAKHYNLQETICDNILHSLLQHKDIHAAKVCMYKTKAYANAKGVGVERFEYKEPIKTIYEN